MDTDSAMIEFAVKWRHWDGGPDEDIFVEFGIPAYQFFFRLRQLLSTHRWPQLTPRLVTQLTNICDSRLHVPETRAG